MQLKDITGQRFGRLVVLEREEDYISPKGVKKVRWLCVCDCGNKALVVAEDLRRGHTYSCGCYQKEMTSNASIKHGKRNTKIYHVWQAMKDRCNNPKNKRFRDWGGRGIAIYDEWQDDFQAFYNYVSKLPHFGEAGYSIDRINNDGNYEPNNIRWATRMEQNRNRRNVKNF